MILEAAFAIAIDGDTLKVNNEQVRLWGIQAPERGGVGWQGAKQALQSAVKDGVMCHVWTRDRYGRHVGMCFVQGQDVAWRLRAVNLAEDWPKYSKGYYK